MSDTVESDDTAVKSLLLENIEKIYFIINNNRNDSPPLSYEEKNIRYRVLPRNNAPLAQ